jgi:hypothetical protein
LGMKTSDRKANGYWRQKGGCGHGIPCEFSRTTDQAPRKRIFGNGATAHRGASSSVRCPSAFSRSQLTTPAPSP